MAKKGKKLLKNLVIAKSVLDNRKELLKKAKDIAPMLPLIEDSLAGTKVPTKKAVNPPSDMTEKETPKMFLGLDIPYSLYDVTDMFYNYYKYHNEEKLISWDYVYIGKDGNPRTKPTMSSRFETFRKIEAMRLGARPYSAREKISVARPNISLGYLRLLLDYLVLPYKSMFTDSDLVKVRINKTLYNEEHLSENEKEEVRIIENNNPIITSNKEISDDVSDAFANVLRHSKKIKQCIDIMPLAVAQNGFAAFTHSDLDYQPMFVHPLDFITEPRARWDASNWGTFFVIRKVTVQEIQRLIREFDGQNSFWNTKALRWALESAVTSRGLLSGTNTTYNLAKNSELACGENVQVRSFYSERTDRVANINGYYGDLYLVEGYYVNEEGDVDKIIFYPSSDFVNVPNDMRMKQSDASFSNKRAYKKISIEENFNKDANILFYRKGVYKSMREAVTVIPFDRGEPSLERQRGFAHELYNPIEMIMRLDSAILNFAILMGTPFTKNRVQGTNAENIEDLEITFNGDMVDLGDKDFVETPFSADLNGMVGVRNMLIQHAMSKAFLGGLDGQETLAAGRGANLANLRLVRDGRVHKHNVECFAESVKEFYTKIFKKVLEMSDKDLNDDVTVQKLFFDTLTDILGYPKEIFEYKESEVIDDTMLPYWMELEAIRNGGSHFGAAEMVLYSEIKQVFGDGLDQKALQSLNRMGIKSLLGSQDAIDILGNPRDALVTSQDQVYRATVETTALLGSVDGGVISFEAIPILEDKDDHVTHLTQVHNPKAQEIIKQLQEGNVTPDVIAEMSEQQLESRNDMILKLAALSNHIALHQAQLAKFGSKRQDINQLKEETNAILQSAEGLLNSLQLSLRALKQKQDEAALKMQNLSPENQAEQMKQQTEMMKVQVKREEIQAKLMLANKIADQGQQQHMDKQVTAARDRQAKIDMAARDREARLREKEMDAAMKAKTESKSSKKSKSSK